MASSKTPAPPASAPATPSATPAPQSKGKYPVISPAEAAKLGIPTGPVLVLSPTPSRASKPSRKG